MSEEREVNIPLLRKAVEWVEYQAALPDRQREWYQASWIYVEPTYYNEETQTLEAAECGTAYCVAGYVAQLVDERFRTSQWVTEADGKTVHSSEVAAEALGLTVNAGDIKRYRDDVIHPLFHSRNTAEDVRRIAEDIAGEPL